MAVDVAPYPLDWKNIHKFYLFAGFVLGIVEAINANPHLNDKIKIRWGGDWDSDYDLNDQTFNDLVHFEIKE